MVVWNTPAPPLALYQPALFNSSTVRHAFNLEEAKGVTFFFCGGLVMGIHVHGSPGSRPMDTATRIANAGRNPTWIYLPLSPDDPPIALGVRTANRGAELSILVRTQRAGGVILGRHHPPSADLVDKVLATSRPITMVYGEPGPGNVLNLFGAHPGLAADAEAQVAPFSTAYPQPNPISRIMATYFSWAPLANVSSTVAYYDDATGDCRGVVLHYEGGGARAVGECRLHVDRAERVDRPARVCFRTELVDSQSLLTAHRVQAKFEQHAPSQPDSGLAALPAGWQARPMRGVVKFWFMDCSWFLAVEDY